MSVLGLVGEISKFFQIKTDKVRIDNLVFQLHYRFTTSIFLASSIFITAFSLLGEPIRCHLPNGPKDEYINQFCWTMSTFTYKTGHEKQLYPGIGMADSKTEGDRRYHTYYQWVPFLLFFHGLCFYLPHWIWKIWEGGKVKAMSDDIRGTTIVDNDTRKIKREQVVDFIIKTLRQHTKYAYAYLTCEILNFINVVVTMFIIDKSLGNVFMTYGLKVLSITFRNNAQRFPVDGNDTLIETFPRITACYYKSYGGTGDKQDHYALCVLALNNLNEKIYIFVWFWLMILAAITLCAIAYSIAFLSLADIRRMVIVNRFKFGNKYEVNELIRQIGTGDFLLLHLLGQNLSKITFHQLLEDLNNRLLYPENSKKKNSYINSTDANKSDKPSSHTDNLYPTYFKNMDTMELDSVSHSKEPLIRSDEKDDQKLEKSICSV